MNYNRVTLMGRITRDVELRYLPNQMPCVDIGLAINHKFKDKEEVCFVDVTFFNKQAETIAQYMTKGSPILIDGRLKLDSWEDQNGNKRQKMKVVGERFTFVGGKQGEGQQSASPIQHGPGYPGTPQNQPPPQVEPSGDDIPF